MKRSRAEAPERVLVIDVGGHHVKVVATPHRTPRKIASGPHMTAAVMIERVLEAAADWTYDPESIGYPGRVRRGVITQEPANLAVGWVGFDFAAAFGKPLRIVNDAAMQALGSYRHGTMLFLGLGTGLGSALIVDGRLCPMELAHLPYKHGRTYEDYVGRRGLRRTGKKKWRKNVEDVIERLRAALEPDDVVIGGGNAKLLRRLPAGARWGDNADAIEGGARLWRHPDAHMMAKKRGRS
jgi:polyphosphate glucokinase